MNEFKQFVEIIGTECGFKTKYLISSLVNYCENQQKPYDKLLKAMQNLWKRYSEKSQIAYLLLNHHNTFFKSYLCDIFPYRSDGLVLKNSYAPTPVDFKLEYFYYFNQTEIQIITELVNRLQLDVKFPRIFEKIFVFTISSASPLIEKILPRRFAFQFSNLEIKEFNDEIEVWAIMSAREQ